uniref:Uncharacterized protein n=1 Tax=Plectus sambesii TaxID=2011161 RepID=A0A914WJN3_9BILA
MAFYLESRVATSSASSRAPPLAGVQADERDDDAFDNAVRLAGGFVRRPYNSIREHSHTYLLRPRSSTVGESFKKMLASAARRRSAGGRSPRTSKNTSPNGSSGSSLNGSLLALYSPSGRLNTNKTVTILVVGTDECGKREFVDKLLESWLTASSHKIDKEERSVQFRDMRGIRKVCFIELDAEKDDLWTTLEGHGYIVLFSVQHGQSYREATENIGYITQQRNEDAPIWLVGVTPDPANTTLFSQRAVSAHDAKMFAKENNSHYCEVAKDGKTKRSPLAYSRLVAHIVSIFAEATSDVGGSLADKKIKFDFDQTEARRKTSRSCDDLSLLLASERFF